MAMNIHIGNVSCPDLYQQFTDAENTAKFADAFYKYTPYRGGHGPSIREEYILNDLLAKAASDQGLKVTRYNINKYHKRVYGEEYVNDTAMGVKVGRRRVSYDRWGYVGDAGTNAHCIDQAPLGVALDFLRGTFRPGNYVSHE